MSFSFKKSFEFLVDFIFPKEETVASLEKMADTGNIHALPSAEFDNYSFIHPVFNYRDRRVRALVWAIKYKRNNKLAEVAGEILYEHILGQLEDCSLFDNQKKFILSPVPISKKKMQEKGFNQAELLCEKIVENDTGNLFDHITDVLEKTKNTAPQTTLKKGERLENLKGAFVVNPKINVSGKTIILIDDVVTTGATIVEIKRTLKEAGAKKFIAFTLAH